MRKTLFFDFDGTIVDTKSVYYKEIYNVVRIFGYKYSQVDKAIDLGLSLTRTLKRLGLSSVASWFTKRKITHSVVSHIDEVKKCKDVDSIKNLSKDYNKILVSNSLKEFILPIVKRLGLNKCFREVYGTEDFVDKADFLKDYIVRKKLDRKKCFYIGDRGVDVEVAKRIGCRSVIVSGVCAWDSRKEVLKHKPDFIISDIKDLNKILK